MDESLSQERTTTPAFLVIEPRRMLSALLSFSRTYVAELLAAALLAAMSFQMLAVISRKSITLDEIVMIPAAYYHLAAGNFQLINEHPPLSTIIAAVPLLFVQPNEVRPDQLSEARNFLETKWAYQDGFWENSSARFEVISFWARVPMILLAVALGLLVFRFARELFGTRAAVLAVALYSLEPTVLAHGRVVQTDMPAAFGFLLFFMALYRYTHQRDWRRASWLGIAAGIAILTKYSMLLTGPVLAIFFLVVFWRAHRSGERISRPISHAALVLIAIVVMINAAYFFQHRSLGEADLQWIQGAFPARSVPVTFVVNAFGKILPADFLLGIAFQFWHNSTGHPAGLLGMHSQTGWWYYFPVAFALKTTLPFLILSLASLPWGIYRLIRHRDTRLLWLLSPFAIYTTFVLFSRLDIGVRYYLPAYPLLFLLGAALLDQMLKSRRARRAGALVAISLLCWIGVEAVRAYPNHISYMNQLASSRPHWWYLSDSNVEWGDDTREVGLYLRQRGESRVRSAFLGDFLLLHHYGVQPLRLANPVGDEPEHTRYVAIGASYLNGSTIPEGTKIQGRWVTELERQNLFDAYRRRTPEAIIGGSIYIYRDDQR